MDQVIITINSKQELQYSMDSCTYCALEIIIRNKEYEEKICESTIDIESTGKTEYGYVLDDYYTKIFIKSQGACDSQGIKPIDHLPQLNKVNWCFNFSINDLSHQKKLEKKI